MKYRLSFLFFLTLFFLASCNNADIKQGNNTVHEKSVMDTLPQELVFNLQEILENKGENGLINVFIAYDQYFKKPKKFLGYELKPLLDSLIKVHHFDTTNRVIVFECGDGYRPSMVLSKALSDTKGYIVIKDKEATGHKNWIDSLATKFTPYYLVWQNIKPSNHTFPWPYGLTKIRLIPVASEYQTIYPYKNPEMVKGFTLFKDNCNKCHSVNHIGGVMGPEFNVPKNITEYWREEDILAFALNPKSYRSSSQMPPMRDVLSIDEIKTIINYLKFVLKQKVVN